MTEGNRQDPITLADLIRLESGLDARESTRLADAWVDEIRREIGTSGISIIKGLGTFTTSGDGLRFELDSDFPVVYDLPEVEGFVRGTQSEDLEPSNSQPVASEERLSKEAIVPADEVSDEASNESSDVTTDDTVDANDGTTEAAPAHVPATPDTAPGMPPGTLKGLTADTGVEPSPAPPSTSPSHRDRRLQRSSSTRAGWVALALLLVVSGAVVFSLVQGDGTDPVAITSSPPEPAEPFSEETAGPTPEEVQAGLPDDKDISEETTPMKEIPIVEAPHAMIPGSTEDQVDETRVSISQGMGGYTLIIGSALRQERVQSLLASYEALGWPQGILRYESENGIRYRAAVGHFSTAALADSARTRFASDLPDGTWVLSVR